MGLGINEGASSSTARESDDVPRRINLKTLARMPGVVNISEEAYWVIAIGTEEISAWFRKTVGEGGATVKMLAEVHERMRQLQAVGFAAIEKEVGRGRMDVEVDRQGVYYSCLGILSRNDEG